MKGKSWPELGFRDMSEREPKKPILTSIGGMVGVGSLGVMEWQERMRIFMVF